MAHPTKEYQAFTSLVDQLLTISKEELDRRMVAYRDEASKRTRPGPKPKKRRQKAVTPSAASRDAGE
jgi:hypothetical protein